MRGVVRVLKSQLEDGIGESLEIQSEVVQWLVRWSAMVPSRFLVGKGGKTAYERRRGRKCLVPTEVR